MTDQSMVGPHTSSPGRCCGGHKPCATTVMLHKACTDVTCMPRWQVSYCIQPLPLTVLSTYEMIRNCLRQRLQQHRASALAAATAQQNDAFSAMQ